MLKCLLFGSLVLIAMFLIPLGGKYLRTLKTQTCYKYTLLALYVGGILWLTLANRLGMEVSRYRFKPFYVVRQMLNCWFGFKKISAATCRAVFRNTKNLFASAHASPVEDLLLNIVLFLPIGFLLPYVWPKFNFWKTALAGLLFSSVIEGVQYLAQWGCCDIDDVINNTLGTCIGYFCYRIYQRFTRPQKSA
ncbi:MAG: VanZ family protein [Elusimicrobiaceae bacterium]|nr:VanZ family protein [Elusimicrobiaceae bacterium]